MKRFPLLLVLAMCMAVAVTVHSAPTAAGKLKVATPGVVLELKINGKPVPVPNGREIPLPVGTYQPALITANAQAKTGKAEIWSIKCTSAFGNLKQIEVKEGELTDINAGPPFVVKPIMYAMTEKGGKVQPIGLAIIGQAGEMYNSGTIMKGMTRVPAPQIRIVDEGGKIITQGAFEYG